MQQLKKMHWLAVTGLAVALALSGCATRPELKVSNYQDPAVGTPSPDKSFWRETVSYPFPVNYGKGKDGRGIVWEIAYMDQYAGKPEDKAKAKTLVLVHGKGADSGYWSQLMKDALGAGLRVIAVDLPHYGKSIPGNLDNPKARTMQDTREAVHDLLVGQLKVTQATYLGHSLGGHWVLGYALSYPDAVEKLAVVGAGSFEAYPRTLKLPNGEMNWLDPSYAHDYARWEQTWEPVFKRLEKERAKTAEDLELFHYWKKKDASGQVVASNVGFYLNNSVDAAYQNAVRLGMLKGPKAEFEAWNVAYNRDVYAMGIELLKDDPNSLPARIPTLKAPMFIAFGEKEPFLPATAVTGNTDLRMDYVKPTYEKIKANGGPAPVVKFYKDAGHFVHTDQPATFNADVIDFVYDGRVNGAEDPASYKLPPVKLPADVQAFVDDFIKALNTGKAELIMPFYAKDFLSDGRDWQKTKEIYEQYGALTAGTWAIKVSGFKLDGDKAELDGSLSNQYATGSLKGSFLIKQDGQWKMWGNRK